MCDRHFCAVSGTLFPGTTGPFLSGRSSVWLPAAALPASHNFPRALQEQLSLLCYPHCPLVISSLATSLRDPQPGISTPGERLGHRCPIPLLLLSSPLPVTLQGWKVLVFLYLWQSDITSLRVALVSCFPVSIKMGKEQGDKIWLANKEMLIGKY